MMAGMLVPVDEVRSVSKAERAVETLFGVDPDFVLLCKSLYGDDVDPDEVWQDVFKSNPVGPDISTHQGRRRALEAAGIGATVIGGALGVKELKGSARALRGLPEHTPKVRSGKLWPAAKVAGIGAMLGGDVAATANQASSARQRRRSQPVDKVAVPGVHSMARGYEASMRSVLPQTQPTGAAAKLKPRKAKPVQGVPTQNGAIAKAEDIDVVWAGEFSKFDEDKRLVFGWASVVELNGMPVVDRQGDYIHPDDLENASYDYVLKSRVGGDMHQRNGDQPLKISDMVESVVFTPEKIEKMGLPREAAEKIPTGWWIGFKVHDARAWDEVKKGHKGGFSIHGRGKRVPTAMDALIPGYA